MRRYLDLLTGVFMLRQVAPWFENLGKRQVKAPKVYVRDTGLLHTLLGITSRRDLENHPKVGASWEGHAVENSRHSVPTRLTTGPHIYNGGELKLALKFGVRLTRNELALSGTVSTEIVNSVRIGPPQLQTTLPQ